MPVCSKCKQNVGHTYVSKTFCVDKKNNRLLQVEKETPTRVEDTEGNVSVKWYSVEEMCDVYDMEKKDTVKDICSGCLQKHDEALHRKLLTSEDPN